MGVAYYVIAALGLALLMVVHETGHYVAARRYGMRVTRFSIGFGPRLVQHRPKDSATTFQIALIPFLAYVQIAGMNPYEEADPKDKSSYANASLWARIVTIVAGPLANYGFASLLFFFGFAIGGRVMADMTVTFPPGAPGPAVTAGVQRGDRIVSVAGHHVGEWDELREAIHAHPGEAIDLEIDRKGQLVHVTVMPAPKGDKNEGRIGILPTGQHREKIGLANAAVLSLTEPPMVVYMLVRGLARVVAGKEKLDASGPVGIMKETAAAVKLGPGETLQLLGAISAYLGGFNLLPVPALDGGRLLFLGFEAASRRRPDAKVEAGVHAVGLVLMLTLIAIVTYTDIMPKH